ncbi:ABC transporter ATP-binding protein [Leucothrix mucor]|uniref:ABC transporter ATP-binding protein n=1 Tax=Leucothrix mucor TaxID=45248 RepID=UPI0003B5324A|nr:ABC transporter ATP-binding protein [Leucothrix mucor]
MMTETPISSQTNCRLKLSNITKRFGSLVANDNISLSLAAGEVLAILGENGAGKTTLMNILFGHYVSEEGSIEVNGEPLPPGQPQASLKQGIGMVHQHFTLADNLSVLDNITLGTEPLFQLYRNDKAARRRLAELSERFGLVIKPDTLVANLSVGEKQRVEILKALYRGASVLILDEPTAVLTPQEAQQLFSILKQMVAEGLSIIFISHKLHEILAVSDRVMVLRGGKMVGEVLTKDASKASLAELMVGRKVTRPKALPLAIGTRVMALQNVQLKATPNLVALENINLDVHQNEIVGIAGVAGNGQSSLAAIMNGQTLPDGGEFLLFNNPIKQADPRALVGLKVGRIPEDRGTEGVVGEMTVWENLIAEKVRTQAKRGIFINQSEARQEAEQLIEQYDIRCEGPNAETRLLSGGNIQKLILARNFSNNPHFIIANQPIRGLDEGAISFVQEKLLEARQSGAGIVLISEDLDELFQVSDRIAVMFDGQLRGPYPVAQLDVQKVGLMMSGEILADEVQLT